MTMGGWAANKGITVALDYLPKGYIGACVLQIYSTGSMRLSCGSERMSEHLLAGTIIPMGLIAMFGVCSDRTRDHLASK